MNQTDFICCSGCGLLSKVHRDDCCETVILCSRCHTPLMKNFKNSLIYCFLFSLTGLILFYFAISWPLLSVSIGSMDNSTSLLKSLVSLFSGYPLVFAFSLLVVVFVPLLYLVLHFFLSLAAIRRRKVIGRRYALILLSGIREWYMIDVFLVSILISIIKLSGMFDFSFGPGFFFLLALCVTILFVEFYSDIRLFWKILCDE